MTTVTKTNLCNNRIVFLLVQLARHFSKEKIILLTFNTLWKTYFRPHTSLQANILFFELATFKWLWLQQNPKGFKVWTCHPKQSETPESTKDSNLHPGPDWQLCRCYLGTYTLARFNFQPMKDVKIHDWGNCPKTDEMIVLSWENNLWFQNVYYECEW